MYFRLLKMQRYAETKDYRSAIVGTQRLIKFP
jgi:hypothetical protein